MFAVMLKNDFYLGPLSTETMVNTQQSPLFVDKAIRLAGLTCVSDRYLCARLQPKHHTLLLTISGAGMVICEQKNLQLSAGDMLCLPKNISFEYCNHQANWQFIWFILEDTANWHLLIQRLHLSSHQPALKMSQLLLLLAGSLTT